MCREKEKGKDVKEEMEEARMNEKEGMQRKARKDGVRG
jgi:hypothetical protein